MPGSLAAVYVIVLLLPGFVGYLALAKIYNRTIDDAFDKVALIVLITALSLALIALVHEVAIPASNAAITGSAVRDFVTITFPVQSLLCLVLGAILGAVANLDIFARLARRWQISAKTGQAAVIAATIRQHPDPISGCGGRREAMSSDIPCSIRSMARRRHCCSKTPPIVASGRARAPRNRPRFRSPARASSW